MVIRQQNWLGQQRVDVQHLRALESSAAADMDVLAGQVMAGLGPLVTQGFDLIPLPNGSAATSLQINVANGTLLHPLASENGTLFLVAANRGPETLNAANPRVIGGFTASAVNFIGVDLRRPTSSSSSTGTPISRPRRKCRSRAPSTTSS